LASATFDSPVREGRRHEIAAAMLRRRRVKFYDGKMQLRPSPHAQAIHFPDGAAGEFDDP